MVTTIYFYATPRVEEKETVKKVYVQKPYTIDGFVQRLLSSERGVANAWIDKIDGTKVHCFVTNVLEDEVSIFSYCKAEKPIG